MSDVNNNHVVDDASSTMTSLAVRQHTQLILDLTAPEEDGSSLFGVVVANEEDSKQPRVPQEEEEAPAAFEKVQVRAATNANMYSS
jgi:hypothetical protein